MANFTRKEAAARLKLSVRSVDYLIADRRLKVVRIGPRRVLVPEAEVIRLETQGDNRYITAQNR
jgi:excisionase family DNA binding protein